MAIRIVTDSASDLPPEIAQRYDVYSGSMLRYHRR